MTVAIKGRGMTSESVEEKQETRHEFNYFIDRQLQNKLLQADEDLLVEEEVTDKSINRNNLKSGKVTKTDVKVDKFGDFSGWFSDQKLVYRKLDGATKTDQKPRESTFIHPWKDYKRNREESYVFKHFTDSKKYIDQYRKEHSIQNNRFSSGSLDRERRYAYPQNHAPQQPPVQVQVQALWKGTPSTSVDNPALHYTNRKESLGSLVTPTPTNSSCNCSKPNHTAIHTDSTSQAHRYKLVTSPFSRVNTADIRSLHGDSDNSSESGDSRTKTPRPRVNSAASVKGRAIVKSPTKISVPSQGVHNGVRPYPIQALTIQQTSSKSSDSGPVSSPKPLDNLNVVAPEKQAVMVERKEVEPIIPSIQAHNSNSLISSNEAPLRGYAVRKSQSHQTNPSDVLESEFQKNKNVSFENDSETDSELFSDAVSIERLSTCPLSADVRVKHRIDVRTSQMLQMFLKDPVLSKLNQRPPINGARSVAATPKLINQGTLPHNDADAMYRVNMWNPVVSTPPKMMQTMGSGNPDLRNSLVQKPFRKPSHETYIDANSSFGKTVQIVHELHERDRLTGKILEKKDIYHPVKKIKMSITRLDNAVSFCRTHIQTKDDFPVRKSSHGKPCENSYDRFIKSVKINEDSDNNHTGISSINTKVSETACRKSIWQNDECSPMEEKLIDSSRNCTEISNTVGVKKTMNESTVNTPPVKQVSFSGIRTDRLNSNTETVVSETGDQGHENLKADKLFECPSIKEPDLNKSAINSHRSKMFEYSPAQNRFGNQLESDRKDVERRHYKNKIFELSLVKDNCKLKNVQNTQLGEQSESKPGISLPKPTFAAPSPLNKREQDREIIKDIKVQSVQNSELSCNTFTLQSNREDSQNWRLTSIKNNTEEKYGLHNQDNPDDKDISTSIIKGNKIIVENGQNKDLMHGAIDIEVDSPRSSQRGQSGKRTSRRVKKTALASGRKLDDIVEALPEVLGNRRGKAFISEEQGNKKRLYEHQDLEGLTWAEKLEFLRSVNKRPEKPKPKPQKLRYVKDEPDTLPASEHEQLYEQRRIKHLVEQARIKGGKQYDWVHEAKVKAKGVDLTSDKEKTGTDELPEGCDSDNSSVGTDHDEGAQGERKFGKYGIYVPQKGASRKLFDCHNISRSNTCLFSS